MAQKAQQQMHQQAGPDLPLDGLLVRAHEVPKLERLLEFLGNCSGSRPKAGGYLRVIGGGGVWRMGADQAVLTVGTKGLPRNTRCRASSALTPFLRAVET